MFVNLMLRKTLFTITAMLFTVTATVQAGVAGVDVALTGKKATVKWFAVTGDEEVTYIVQRSKDGESFKDITELTTGMTYETVEFLETDRKPLKGTSFYRIKTIANGEVSYSDIAVLRNPKKKQRHQLNPSMIGEKALIVVQGPEGQEYYSKVFIKNIQPEIKAMDLKQGIPEGRYIVVATSNEAFHFKKVTVE